jgi:GT2 family glycosyltransferase
MDAADTADAAIDVSIVIPSWNTRELLRACLASLERHGLPHSETIVIENASGDGSADMVAREFPRVRLVRNAENVGFARGCNQGLRLARGRHALLLNADTEVHAGALALLLAWLDQHPEYGAAAPRLVHPDGSTQRACQAFPTLATALWFGTPLERWFPDSRELRRYFLRDWDQEDDRDVEQPPAACLMLRREALEAVGLFDEELWLFYNDVDLSKRLAAAGFRTRYVAQARVLHHVGRSTRQFGRFLPEWHKNRLHYYRKHHGRLAGAWLKLCVTSSAADWVATQLGRRFRGRPSEPIRPLLGLLREFLAL